MAQIAFEFIRPGALLLLTSLATPIQSLGILILNSQCVGVAKEVSIKRFPGLMLKYNIFIIYESQIHRRHLCGIGMNKHVT